MFKFLKKSYPFNDDLNHNAKVILFISIVFFAFLYLFQPFDINAFENAEKLYLIAGIVVVTFLALSLNLMILPSIFPKLFISKKWNVKKEILWNIWILFTISGGNLLYYHMFGLLEFKFTLLLQIVLTAVLPTTFLITINQDRLRKKNLQSALELNKKLKENRELKSKIITFESEYGKENLEIKLSSLILIKSANNYIEVFWNENNQVKNQMIRSSMFKTEKLFKDYKFIFRSHRSFIVNIEYIIRIEGNSLGYKLFLENLDFPVPVSQKYTSKLKDLI